MNTHHTPGPWLLENGVISDAKGRAIPIISPWIEGAFDTSDKEALANNQLMAVAPEMLEAIRSLASLTTGLFKHKLDAIIAKATRSVA